MLLKTKVSLGSLKNPTSLGNIRQTSYYIIILIIIVYDYGESRLKAALASCIELAKLVNRLVNSTSSRLPGCDRPRSFRSALTEKLGTRQAERSQALHKRCCLLPGIPGIMIRLIMCINYC